MRHDLVIRTGGGVRGRGDEDNVAGEQVAVAHARVQALDRGVVRSEVHFVFIADTHDGVAGLDLVRDDEIAERILGGDVGRRSGLGGSGGCGARRGGSRCAGRRARSRRRSRGGRRTGRGGRRGRCGGLHRCRGGDILRHIENVAGEQVIIGRVGVEQGDQLGIGVVIQTVGGAERVERVAGDDLVRHDLVVRTGTRDRFRRNEDDLSGHHIVVVGDVVDLADRRIVRGEVHAERGADAGNGLAVLQRVLREIIAHRVAGGNVRRRDRRRAGLGRGGRRGGGAGGRRRSRRRGAGRRYVQRQNELLACHEHVEIVVERGEQLVVGVVVNAVALAERGRRLPGDERVREERIIRLRSRGRLRRQPEDLAGHHVVVVRDAVDLADHGEVGVEVDLFRFTHTVDRVARFESIARKIAHDLVVGGIRRAGETGEERCNETYGQQQGKKAFFHISFLPPLTPRGGRVVWKNRSYRFTYNNDAWTGRSVHARSVIGAMSCQTMPVRLPS